MKLPVKDVEQPVGAGAGGVIIWVTPWAQAEAARARRASVYCILMRRQILKFTGRDDF